MKQDREYRMMEIQMDAPEEKENKYLVRGYASTFDSYPLFISEDGTEYFERIEPTAFDGSDLSDVVFRIDHEGRVYARSSAGSVKLWVDSHGLGNETDLSRTERAKELYADIAAGNYPQMSFAFTVAEDHYEKETRTRVIDRIAKVFDISPVSFPANPFTELSIATRKFLDGVIEEETAERLERESIKRSIEKILIEQEIRKWN